MLRTAEPSHSKPRRWKIRLTHHGWFTVLYMQHLLISPTTELEICMSIYSTLLHYFPLPVDPPPPRVLACGLHGGKATPFWQFTPLPPNVTNSRYKPQQTPSVEKHAYSPSVVYCDIYAALTIKLHKLMSWKFA